MNRRKVLIGVLALALVSLTGSLRGPGATASYVVAPDEPTMGRSELPAKTEGPVAPRVPRGASPAGRIPLGNEPPVGQDALTDLGTAGSSELNDLERAKLDLALRAIAAAEAAGTRTMLVLESAPIPVSEEEAETRKLELLRSLAPMPIETPVGFREEPEVAEKGGRP